MDIKELDKINNKKADIKLKMANINDPNLKKTALNINSYLEVQIKQEIQDNLINVHNGKDTLVTTKSEQDEILESFKCSICYKPHANLDDYTEHMQNYHTNHYECEYCDATFTLRTSLNQHKKIHNSTTDMLNICDICGAIYEKLYALKIHMRTHTEEKPFSCDICQRRFRLKANLKRHVNSLHVKYKKNECDVCHEKFDKRVQLMSHQRTHTGKKPFECYVCHKTYEEKGPYNTHMFSHRETFKRFKCDICHKGFHYNCQLSVHKKIHSDNKPFECDVCHKRFYQKGNFMCHIKIHNPNRDDKPHECGICKMRFYYKNKLESHMRKSHRADLSFECKACFRRYDCEEKLVKHVKRTCSKKN